MKQIQFNNPELFASKDAWDRLSLAAKAEMMKVAVKNGIYDLQTIRNKYNEFAEGGEVEEEELPPIVPFKQRTEVIITPDPEYNQYLNTLPDNQRFTPNDAYDSYYYWKLNGKPKNFEEAYSKGMFHYDHSDNGYHANSIAFGDDGIGYFMKPKTHDTVGYETDWFNKGLVTEEGGKQRPMTPEEKAEWLDFRSKYMLTNDPARLNYYMYKPKNKHSIGGPLVDVLLNEYAKGGGIHIKPSHRGRLTELKKRTGKSEAELYRTGSAATRKMITFARNARKWKHGEGGNLFYPGGDITYGHPFYSYDDNGQLILDENGKPILNYNASIPEIVITPSREPIGLDRLNKGMNSNSNHTVGEYARKAGEDAVRETRRQLDEAAARFNSHNEMYSQVPVGEVSGLPIYKTVKDQKVIGMSGTDPVGEFFVMGEALGPLFKAVPMVYRGGTRFIQNVGDRYQGMLDAVDYAANKTIKGNSASDITNYIWRQKQGDIASGRAMLPTVTRGSGLRDISGNGYHKATSEGGNQTIDVHLGGMHTGDKPWELNAMEPSRIKWLNEYLQTAPKGTIFGETGNTMNFAEQYTASSPSYWRAFKDAVTGKVEHNPYWDELKKDVAEKLETITDPDIRAYYQHLLEHNNPLSVDSYKMMLDMARKGKYGLRYDSTPMGLFNSQGVRQRDFYNSLLDMTPEEQVKAINSWIKKINPEARPAYLQDGEVMIPRPLLFKNTPSANSWLRATKK